MLKHYINRPVTTLVLLTVLLTGCGLTQTSTQTDVPDQVQQAYHQALQSMKAGQNDQAIKQFTSIALSNPSLAGPHTNLGMIYLKLNSLDKAEQALLKAVQLNPTNSIGFNYLGIVYRHQGRFDDAEKTYLKALEINGKYAYAHLNLGILYDLYKSDLSKALSHYQKYLSLSPEQDKTVEKWIVDLKRRDTARNTAQENQG